MKTAVLGFLLIVALSIPQLSLAELSIPQLLLGDKPPTDAKPLSEIVLSLEKQGYTPIVEIEFDDERWEIEAYKEGQKRELKVDPRSGAIISDRPDYL